MAWIPDGYSPREYVRDLLITAFPAAYAFEGTEDEDVAAYLAAPDGVAQLQRYVADAPDARIPDWMRQRLRTAADGRDPRPGSTNTSDEQAAATFS